MTKLLWLVPMLNLLHRPSTQYAGLLVNQLTIVPYSTNTKCRCKVNIISYCKPLRNMHTIKKNDKIEHISTINLLLRNRNCLQKYTLIFIQANRNFLYCCATFTILFNYFNTNIFSMSPVFRHMEFITCNGCFPCQDFITLLEDVLTLKVLPSSGHALLLSVLKPSTVCMKTYQYNT